MNPNAYPVKLSMGWGIPSAGPSYTKQQAARARKAQLHAEAVKRRRKAKRGGKR